MSTQRKMRVTLSLSRDTHTMPGAAVTQEYRFELPPDDVEALEEKILALVEHYTGTEDPDEESPGEEEPPTDATT